MKKYSVTINNNQWEAMLLQDLTIFTESKFLELKRKKKKSYNDNYSHVIIYHLLGLEVVLQTYDTN